MRFVEGIRSERFPVAPYFLAYFRIVAVFLRSLDELGLHLVQHILFLLTHRLAQRVGLAARESCKLLREQHDLLLIDGNAISVLQVLLHIGNIVGHLFLTVLTRDERGNILHRPRTIERIHRNQVLEAVGFQVAQMLFHAR